MRYEALVFRDRNDAAERLAAALRGDYERPVVLGIPRGGVVLSSIVARRLDAVHGVVVARKLGAPRQSELAVGAVTANGSTYINEETAELAGADAEYLAEEIASQMERAKRYEDSFDSRRRPAVGGRDVIIVDDGVATGATAIAAIRSMKTEGARRVIFAVPVGPPHTIERLQQEADEVICLIKDPQFFAVGQFYRDFSPVTDSEVRDLVNEFAPA
jgi:predicted phosphoribosyltransferase